MGSRVDDAGGSSDALQSDRLPHDQQLIVSAGGVSLTVGSGSDGTRNLANNARGSRGASRINHDQVTRSGSVNRTLDRVRGGNVSWSFAADCDGHCVDRLLGVRRLAGSGGGGRGGEPFTPNQQRHSPPVRLLLASPPGERSAR